MAFWTICLRKKKKKPTKIYFNEDDVIPTFDIDIPMPIFHTVQGGSILSEDNKDDINDDPTEE